MLQNQIYIYIIKIIILKYVQLKYKRMLNLCGFATIIPIVNKREKWKGLFVEAQESSDIRASEMLIEPPIWGRIIGSLLNFQICDIKIKFHIKRIDENFLRNPDLTAD